MSREDFWRTRGIGQFACGTALSAPNLPTAVIKRCLGVCHDGADRSGWVVPGANDGLETGRTGSARRWVALGLISGGVLFPDAAMAQVQATRDLTVPNFATGMPGRTQAEQAGQAVSDDLIYDFNLPSGLPYAPPQVAPRTGYNLKLGSALVTFFSSLNATYTDNALQAPDGVERQYDITITPTLGASIAWRPRENQGLRVDIGVGYRYSLQFSELNTLTFAPNSFLDYQFVLGDVSISLFNTTTSAAGLRPEIVGQENDPGSIDFNRIDNQAGVRAAWTPYQDLSFSGGYTYGINRGFDDAFSNQDLDQHSFNVGTFLRAHPQLTVGVSGVYSLMRWVEPFQNDLDTWSVGPVISYSPTENLNLSAQVGYSVVDSLSNGAVADNSDFAGWTYGGAVAHRINRNLNHTLSGGFAVRPGVGANYSESYDVGYMIGANLGRGLGVNAGFTWNSFRQSSSGLAFVPVLVGNTVVLMPVQLNVSNAAEVFNINAGTGYQITTKLNGNLGYTYTWRVSVNALEEFNAHSVNLGLNYSF